MADEQDRPDNSDTTPATPPAKRTPAKPAKKAPTKAAKKAPAKKTPTKKAQPEKAPEKAAKKAPPKKTPPKTPQPTPPIAAEPLAAALGDNNGDGQLSAAANEAAAQAKSAIQAASDPLGRPPTHNGATAARLSVAIAVVVSVLAILLIRRLRQDD